MVCEHARAQTSACVQATERLVNKLPRYQDLTALPGDDASRVGASGMGKQQPAWASDTILATRVQLLMSVLGACLPALPQVIKLPVGRHELSCLEESTVLEPQ